MPKTYSAMRKINLGRYGIPYESLDIGVEGAATPEEATSDLNAWREVIHQALTPLARERLDELNAKAKLTMKESDERDELKKVTLLPPF